MKFEFKVLQEPNYWNFFEVNITKLNRKILKGLPTIPSEMKSGDVVFKSSEGIFILRGKKERFILNSKWYIQIPFDRFAKIVKNNYYWAIETGDHKKKIVKALTEFQKWFEGQE